MDNPSATSCLSGIMLFGSKKFKLMPFSSIRAVPDRLVDLGVFKSALSFRYEMSTLSKSTFMFIPRVRLVRLALPGDMGPEPSVLPAVFARRFIVEDWLRAVDMPKRSE